MSGVKGQKWGKKHEQKYVIYGRISKDLKLKLDNYIKTTKTKNTCKAVETLIEKSLANE